MREAAEKRTSVTRIGCVAANWKYFARTAGKLAVSGYARMPPRPGAGASSRSASLRYAFPSSETAITPKRLPGRGALSGAAGDQHTVTLRASMGSENSKNVTGLSARGFMAGRASSPGPAGIASTMASR